MLLFVFLLMLFAAVCGAIPDKYAKLRHILALLCCVTELAFCIAAQFLAPSSVVFGSFCALGIRLSLDGFRKVFCTVICFAWCISLLLSRQYFLHKAHRARYLFFTMMTLGATLGVFLADDLLTAFVFFEVMSFTSYAWVAHEQTDAALKAANTYLTVAVVGGLVALMGLFLLQNTLGSLQLQSLYALAQRCEDRTALYVAGGCILFGFGAKAGMFPLHIWLPKAHPVAPAPASALLSGVLTKSGVWGILAICCNLFRADANWGFVLLLLGVCTMLLGAVLALFSIDLKRTLACSSMSQIGFILVGVAMLCLLGEENALAARGVLLHMMNHTLFKLTLFGCAGIIYSNVHTLDLNALRGYGRGKPLLTVAFLLGAAGISGIPATSGYISKTLLHEAIVEGAARYGGVLTAVEWIFLFSGGLTLAYMTKLFVVIFVEHPSEASTLRKPYCSRESAAAVLIPALLIPLLGLTASYSMDAIAALGTDFMHAGALVHSVNYASLENLKGAAISISIGAFVYCLIVRKLLRREHSYIDRWPARLDLEKLLYEPLLMHWLPGIFGSILRLFGENRVTAFLAAGLLRVAGWAACIFGENRVSCAFARCIMRAGDGVSACLGENRLSTPVASGALHVTALVSEQCGKNRFSGAAAVQVYRAGLTGARMLGQNAFFKPATKRLFDGMLQMTGTLDQWPDKLFQALTRAARPAAKTIAATTLAPESQDTDSTHK